MYRIWWKFLSKPTMTFLVHVTKDIKHTASFKYPAWSPLSKMLKEKPCSACTPLKLAWWMWLLIHVHDVSYDSYSSNITLLIHVVHVIIEWCALIYHMLVLL